MKIEIEVRDEEPQAVEAGLLVVPLTEGAVLGQERGLLEPLEQASGVNLWAELEREHFSGELGQAVLFRGLPGLSARRLLIVGAGNAAKIEDGGLRRVGATAARQANKVYAEAVALALPVGLHTSFEAATAARHLIEGFYRGAYDFDRYKTAAGDDEGAQHEGPSRLLFVGPRAQAAGEVAAGAHDRAAAVRLAQDLVNEPPVVLTPAELARRAEVVATEQGLEHRVFDENALAAEGFRLILAVGGGSANPPRLAHLIYRPEGEVRRKIALVGKGVTFDTGGYSMKPPASMLNMHCDMAGAAAVIGAARAIGALKPEGVEVHFITPCAENAVSDRAIKPQDIIRGYGDKTVEILNTDAEGRLILADALTYAQEQGVDTIIDLATLTGACVVALGEGTAGLFTNSDQLAQQLLDASREAHERFWRMPLTEEMDELLDSPVADMKNVGPRWGGAITAARVLKRWVQIDEWCHLDIAGPAMSEKEDDYQRKGGTGFAVATLVEYVLRLAAAPDAG